MHLGLTLTKSDTAKIFKMPFLQRCPGLQQNPLLRASSAGPPKIDCPGPAPIRRLLVLPSVRYPCELWPGLRLCPDTFPTHASARKPERSADEIQGQFRFRYLPPKAGRTLRAAPCGCAHGVSTPEPQI